MLTMLFLLFQLGDDRYALEASRVVEAVPLLELRRLPQAPKGVAGMINYLGRPVPVVDVSELTLGQCARERLSTRIILVNHADDAGRAHLLGLIAERATDLLHKEPSDLAQPVGHASRAAYLGPVFIDGKGPVQCLREQELLPEPVRKLLFSRGEHWGEAPAPQTMEIS